MKKASFSKRALAFAIDLIAFYISARIAGFNHGGLVVLWLLYETLLVSQWQGYTIGKRTLGLRVVTAARKPVTISKAFVRAIGKLISTAVFLLGDLWMLKGENSKTWHDKMAGTVVVE